MVAAGRFLFRYRNALFPFAGLLVLLPAPALFAHALDAAAVGLLLAALGQFVRAATIGLAYIIRGGRRRTVYAEELVTDGIYSHTRNPMYVGNVLIYAGIAVAANNLTALAVAIPLVIMAYCAIVAAEEQFLRAKFGAAFEAYCRTVPRWLPRVGGLDRTFAAMRFHWRRLIVKEYGTPFGWINVLSLVTLYNLWHGGEWYEHSQTVTIVIAVMAVTTLLWLIARAAKKTRLLVGD